jgi:hypothetical protein
MSSQDVINQNIENLKNRFGTIARTGGSGSQRVVKKALTKPINENKNINEVVSKLQA